ncbi:phosphotransferase family protein [Rhodococcus sp. WS4]|nr:phosphotransferase family protein [Rhodococcus sp. WS4]
MSNEVETKDWVSDRVTLAVAELKPDAVVTSVKRMTGGASSLTYSASIVDRDQSEQTFVVKIAPPGLPPTLNRDVLRQARVLRALASTEVPVPTVLREDIGRPPEIPPLVVMSLVPGQCLEPLTHREEANLPGPGVLRRRSLHAASVMAHLHSARPVQLGLQSEPVTSLRDEVLRWRRVFSAVPDDLAVGADEVGELLLSRLPEPMAPALVHGDLRLGNMLCEGEEVRAVIDWETWTIGDPRIDVGWLAMSSDAERQPHAVRTGDGMATPDEVLDVYATEIGAKPADIEWFVTLSQYRAGAMTALIVKHDRRRSPRNSFVSWWDPEVPQRFVALARERLA